MTSERSDVVVVGGGVIGLAIAWRAARAGLGVELCDPDPGGGASWAAAGMLAPLSEASPLETMLFPLASESLARWPGFAGELTAETGDDVGLREEGTLSVAFGEDDRRLLLESLERCRPFGLTSEWLSGRACRRLEPALTPALFGGFEVPTDLQVDNRAVVRALTKAFGARGVLHRSRVVAVRIGGVSRCHEVVLEGGAMIRTDQVVLATGAAPWLIDGLPAPCRPPLRPVRGDIVRLWGDPSAPVVFRVLRAHVRGRHVYVVPRRGGEVVIGATSEEGGYRMETRSGAAHDLLHDAICMVPELAELEFKEVIGRLRPATPDNAPVIGATPVAGVLVAAGHYRNGFLLAPVTAEAIVAELLGAEVLAVAAPFALGRFG